MDIGSASPGDPIRKGAGVIRTLFPSIYLLYQFNLSTWTTFPTLFCQPIQGPTGKIVKTGG